MSDSTAIGLAKPEDISSVKQIVDSAYTMYIERMGKCPAPMTVDYEEVRKTGNLYTLKCGSEIAGAIVLQKDGDALMVDNLVVDPRFQGKGFGRVLMDFADRLAREQGLTAITLYTNVKMVENIGLYNKLGFTETGRRIENGYDRVFFRKEMAQCIGVETTH